MYGIFTNDVLMIITFLDLFNGHINLISLVFNSYRYLLHLQLNLKNCSYDILLLNISDFEIILRHYSLDMGITQVMSFQYSNDSRAKNL